MRVAEEGRRREKKREEVRGGRFARDGRDGRDGRRMKSNETIHLARLRGIVNIRLSMSYDPMRCILLLVL